MDGNAATRWSSAFGDPQWLRVDLGSFFSRWLRDDARFTPFLCGSPRDADRNNTSLVTQWTDTCPF
ncbi:hypothetical protein ACIBO5_58385 [Nonomuraea angiospora]|uniref:galactose-binding domain-containing protein n=1 Tax=Nonomuraea angiospora TaxID=46172 RepID=UPI0029AC31AB|nr:hypothetical protein [Nonomuraea angiospora]MDX3104149.1 hypothetical protein [Nonomuraea angiospora]